MGDTSAIPPMLGDRSISSAIDARLSPVPGPRSDRGHRASTTAAEISNPLAASKRASERANKRTSDHERAHDVCKYGLLHYIGYVRVICVYVVRTHVVTRDRRESGGILFGCGGQTRTWFPPGFPQSPEIYLPRFN